MDRLVIAGLEQICSEMSCSKKTLYKWIRQRQFPAFKLDGIWRCRPKDVDVWLERQRRTATSRGSGRRSVPR